MGQNKLGARTSNHKISTELISYPNKLPKKPKGLGYGSQLSSGGACKIGSLTLITILNTLKQLKPNTPF